MSPVERKKLFQLARASVVHGLPILIDPGDFGLIPTGEGELQDSSYFSLSRAPEPNRKVLYEALRELIDNGGGAASKLGIPRDDKDSRLLEEWYAFTLPRNYKFEAAPPYRVGDRVKAGYYWISRDSGVPRYPRFR